MKIKTINNNLIFIFKFQNSNMSTGRIVSLIFRSVFFLMMVFNYTSFTIFTWFPILITNYWANIPIILFHVLFFMALWCTYVTVKSDPGQVPLYWGFYMGDPDSKRSRYCLMCNVFKPIRCHHCSMCNRCVLNMDHHCPWINNCIGFYNRKYFIQMVCYINLTLIFVLCTNAKIIYDYAVIVFNHEYGTISELIGYAAFILLYFLDIIMEIILVQFFKFHIKLILENKTTIETLDHKGQEFKSQFDKGKWENFIEVMGLSKVLWFIPLKTYYGKPKGNGIDWGELVEENNQNIPMVGVNNQAEEGHKEGFVSDDRSDNMMNKETTRNPSNTPSTLTRNNAGHSSMSSLYGGKSSN